MRRLWARGGEEAMSIVLTRGGEELVLRISYRVLTDAGNAKDELTLADLRAEGHFLVRLLDDLWRHCGDENTVMRSVHLMR